MHSDANNPWVCKSVKEGNFALISGCTGLENSLAECNLTAINDPMADCRDNNCLNNGNDERHHAQLICRQGITNTCTQNCMHFITCTADCSKSEIRLVNGTSYREGRVEVCVGGRWGTVCGEGWTNEDAGHVCEYFGYPSEGYNI